MEIFDLWSSWFFNIKYAYGHGEVHLVELSADFFFLFLGRNLPSLPCQLTSHNRSLSWPTLYCCLFYQNTFSTNNGRLFISFTGVAHTQYTMKHTLIYTKEHTQWDIHPDKYINTHTNTDTCAHSGICTDTHTVHSYTNNANMQTCYYYIITITCGVKMF